MVHGAIETLKELVNGKSLCRYGDGEIRLCLGMDIRFQNASDDLQQKLLHILRSDVEKSLIAVPYFSDEEMLGKSKKKAERWLAFRRKLIAIWNPKKEYYCAFVSRPDQLILEDFDLFYSLWEKIWSGRKVVIVQSEGNRFEYRTPVGMQAREIKHVIIPKEHAYEKYSLILNECKSNPKDSLFLVTAGPTATALCSDLTLLGFQAIDVGQLGRLWKTADSTNI